MSPVIPAMAQLTGTVYTTDLTGTTVQGSLFTNKYDVYLNGGPQNQNAGSGLPDGVYYFQVTDPSGAILLSADDISCRSVQVTNGAFAGVPSGAPACSHPVSTVDASIVQLCPTTSGRTNVNPLNPSGFDANNWCDSTPNHGGVYKVWVTPASALTNPPPCSNPTYGFCDATSKTKTFKVRSQNAAYVTVCKFNDLNGNATQDLGEPNISGWPISASGVDLDNSNSLGTVNTVTDDKGCVSFSVSDFSSGGQVTLTEGLETGWDQTAPAVGKYTVPDGAADGKTVSVTVNANTAVPPTNFQTLTLAAGDNVVIPFFGNTCVSDACGGNTIQLGVTKTASPSFTRTYAWGISKSVKNPTVYSTNGGTSDAANFAINVTLASTTDSAWQTTGTITLTNPSFVPIAGVSVTDALEKSGLSCSVTGGTDVTVPAATDMNTPGKVELSYTCTYSALPADDTNQATATWDNGGGAGSGTASGTADVKFSGATIKYVDGTVNVTDTLDKTGTSPGTTTALGSVSVAADGTLSVTGGTVDSKNPAQADFTYSPTFADAIVNGVGTCTTHTNTATFTSTTIPVTPPDATPVLPTSGTSNSVNVQDCQFVPLSVGKTAIPGITANVTKTGPASPVEVAGTSAMLGYTVTAQENGWFVSGAITVTNPNDWEAVSGSVGDVLPGASCAYYDSVLKTYTSSANTFTAAASGSAIVSYLCTFATIPTSSVGTNTATATWNPTTYHTTSSSSGPGTAGYDFSTASVAISDTFNSNLPKTLGTLTGLITKLFTFSDSETVTGLPSGGCVAVTNTANAGLNSSTVMESVCNTKTGALTMGFWKNPNGQGIIGSGATTSVVSSACKSGTCQVCNSGTWLRQYNPFQDLSATASCSAVVSYVSNVIGAATCSSSSSTCNAMLRAQMLATALDVYFSDPAGGGNKIGPYTGLGNNQPALGGVIIDLAAIHPCTDGSGGASCTSGSEDTRPEFGISTSTGAPVCLGATVSNMLLYANFNSTTQFNGNPVATPTSGSTWYQQKKTLQVPAKDSFDDFNNQVAPIAPSGCLSTY